MIGIAILPCYLQYLGSAAFGLIGVYAMMQVWLRLFDMGLTPTLSRQVAFIRGQKTDFYNFAEFLRSLELIFLIIAMIIILMITLSRHFLVYQWLKVESLPYSEVVICFEIMGFMVGVRWFIDLYSGGIRGLEEQVWLNKVTAIMSTLQYGGAWCFLRWVSHDPADFFAYQLLINTLNLVVIRLRFIRLLNLTEKLKFNISWSAIKTVLPFSLGLAYSGAIWIFLSQLDSLLFSHLLSLTEFGYFSIAIIVTGGLYQLSSPISLAILPRMTYFLSQGKKEKMHELYHKATRGLSVLTLSATAILAAFPKELLYAWTGNMTLASWAAPIVRWYALGTGVLSICAFQYYLQYAYGKMWLHVRFNTLLVFISVPLTLFVAYHYGPVGTGKLWFFMQLAVFLIYPPIVHYVYARGLHCKWMFHDILPVFISTFFVTLVLKESSFFYIFRLEYYRWALFFWLIAMGLLIIGANMLFSKYFLRFVLRRGSCF